MRLEFNAQTRFITFRFANSKASTIVEHLSDVFIELTEGPNRSTIIACVVAINLADIAQIPRVLKEFEKVSGIAAPVISAEDWKAIQDLCREVAKITLSS